MQQAPKIWGISLWILLALGFLAGVGYLDYVASTELIFACFYLVPVAIVAWYAGRKPGFVMAAVGAAVCLAADIAPGGHSAHMAIARWNSSLLLGFLLAFVVLLSSLRLLQENQKKFSRNDTVTTAINSRYFYELLQAEIERAKRYNSHFTLIYIDLDDFKKVNEAFGHKEGDSALWHCVVTITGVLRKTDTTGRLGGDEFGCLLPETGYAAAESVIARLRTALENEMLAHTWSTTFSMGAVTFSKPPDTSDDAIRMADSLMDAVKKAGKNGVEHKVFV